MSTRSEFTFPAPPESRDREELRSHAELPAPSLPCDDCGVDHVGPCELDRTYLDKLDPDGYCPGFELWDALATDGRHYLIAADYDGSVGTRISMRSDGRLDLVSAVRLGRNPDVAEWERLRESGF